MKYQGVTFCQDFTGLFGDKWERGRADKPAWGYYGKGPQRTALCLLAIALCDAGRTYTVYAQEWRDHPSLLANLFNTSERWDGIKATVLKHYDQFTKEIVSQLPDEWTLTVAEIKEWVRKQQTKQRKYGKAKTKSGTKQTRRQPA